MKVVKDLLLALVNATVLLLIILAVVVLMVVNRTDDLAHDVIEGIAPLAEDLDQIADAVAGIEADLEARPVGEEAEALAREIAALRAEIAALHAPLQSLAELSAQAVAQAVLSRIGGVAAVP
jgi:predicted PurR-regulated permease PerM